MLKPSVPLYLPAEGLGVASTFWAQQCSLQLCTGAGRWGTHTLDLGHLPSPSAITEEGPLLWTSEERQTSSEQRLRGRLPKTQGEGVGATAGLALLGGRFVRHRS